MKWNRNEFIELMTFGDAPRPMFCELFGPLIGLDDEWREQGASEEEINMQAFDWDYVPYVDCGGICGPFGTPEPVVLEETEEHRLIRDHLGRTSKLCKATATLPLPQDFPVKGPEDWERLKPYFVFCEERIDPVAVEQARQQQVEGAVVRCEIPGGWDMARELMGEEEACLAYYTQPELMRDILATLTDTTTRVLERISKILTVDQLSVHEDMAGRSGPLIGPSQVTEFIAPYYRACWEVASSRGTRLFNQDSDGDMRPVLDAFLDCGVNMIHPCEPAAGMDIVEIRKQYGSRLALLGGIDKHVLRKSTPEIDRELAYKMNAGFVGTGGLVLGLDHRIPNGTSLANYRHYVQGGRAWLDLSPLDAAGQGWGRMAF